MNTVYNPVIRAHLDPSRSWGIGLYAWTPDRTCYVKDVVLETRKEGEYTSPFFTLSEDTGSAQMLMDDLWNCGVRPSEGAGTAGAMTATERHLKDLQRLVFKDRPVPVVR